MLEQPGQVQDAQILAMAIANTIPEPFLVLDEGLRVLSASRSFYETFQVAPAETEGRPLFALGDGQWNIPALRHLLETILPDRVAMDHFEVEHDFPGVGRRVMLLNARKVAYDDNGGATILLAFRDVSANRATERELAALLEQTQDLVAQKQMLLEEMQHRVANSLQIIASILPLKARAVSSEETRDQLKDAHQRVMSVAAVQQHLHAVDGVDRVEVGAYLTTLCAGLTASMVGEARPVAITVLADRHMITSAAAVSLGLIVTELVINALKYAFPDDRPDALIMVTYEHDRRDWKLTISDNGTGYDALAHLPAEGGLGTTIVKALAKQLGARVEVDSSTDGFTTSVTRATFPSRLPRAA